MIYTGRWKLGAATACVPPRVAQALRLSAKRLMPRITFQATAIPVRCP